MFLAATGHPVDAPLQLLMHAIGVEAHRPPVAGQHPFERKLSRRRMETTCSLHEYQQAPRKA